MLIRLCRWAGWSVSLLFAYGINRFSHMWLKWEPMSLYQYHQKGKQYIGFLETESQTLSRTAWENSIWAALWQNQQSECAPSEDSDQSGHLPSLIRAFAVHMKKAWTLSYPLSASEYSDQTGQMPRLIWVFAGRTYHFVGFVMRRLICSSGVFSAGMDMGQ